MNRECALPNGVGVYPLTGDVRSKAGNSQVTVTGLQRVPVTDTNNFAGGEFLQYQNATGNWTPTLITGPGNEVFATPNGAAGNAGLRALAPADLPIATTTAQGAVHPDGSTITIDTSGRITAVASSPLTLQTNGTNNASQTLLDLQAGTNVVITNTGGTVTISASGGGGGGFTIKNNFASGGRSLGSGSVYSNATGHTMFVSVSAGLDGGSAGDAILTAWTGPAGSEAPAASSTTSSTHAGTYPLTASVGVSFMVLNGESYYVTCDDLTGAGVYGVFNWTEWN